MIPSFLIEKLKNQYGEELTNKILEGYNQKRKVTLRVNTIKANINEIQECALRKFVPIAKNNYEPTINRRFF